MEIGLFIFLAGFIIGLGSVTVIDILGFLGRGSQYWTEVTVRVHKVTKPLIWIGIILAILGGTILYWGKPFSGIPMWHALFALVLIVNGYFLSFKVSPFLMQREREGRADEILPTEWHKKITASFVVSFIGWWGALALLVAYLT